MITLTETEIKQCVITPEILRSLADFHDMEQDHANSVGLEDCTGNGERAKVLRAEADRLQAEYEA